jgi:hypothetical protein
MKNKKTLLTILLLTLLGISSILASFLLSNRTAFANGGWLSGWTYRRQLTIMSTYIDQPLTDFPVLVKLDSSFFDFSKAKSSGADVRFTGFDGTTLLKYEIERWDSIGGKAEVWVKIPNVATPANTGFYIYYGNSGASDDQHPTDVWDSNYALVMHLNEATGTRYDSTSNNNDGTPIGSVSKAPSGKIDGADEFPASVANMSIADSASLDYGDRVTFEMWINPHGVSGNNFKGGVDKNTGACYFMGATTAQGDGKMRLGLSGTGPIIVSTSALSINTWTYAAAFKNGANAKIYFNGTVDASTTTSPIVCSDNNFVLSIGTRPAYATEHLNSYLDEVRISNVQRSDAWIKATYHSENNSLLTYGNEQIFSSNPTFSDVSYNATRANAMCEFRVKWSDPDGLDECIFSTNNTGTWGNESVTVSGTESWATKTIALNSEVGAKVVFRWYCNDTAGNMGDTGNLTLITDDWPYRMKLQFNNLAVAENLIDFPVLVNLSSARTGSSFWSHVGSSTDDLRFTDSDGTTPLYFEVEYWNYAGNEGLVWVKVPQIDASSTTDFIYLYYGNPTPPANAYRDPTKVWNSDFRMVQHLEESSGTQYDSTTNDNDGTPTNGVTQGVTPGLIDGNDIFDGTDDYVNCTNNPSLRVTTFTLEAWINRTGTGVGTGTGSGGFASPATIVPILTKGKYQVDDLGYNVNYFIGIVLADNKVGFDFEDNTNGGNHPLKSTTAIANNQWYYLTATYDGTTMKIYVNGILDNSQTFSNSTTVPDTNPWSVAIGSAISGPIGGTPARDGAFAGLIDEARIANGARSAGWIKAQYLSMNDQYVTFGSEDIVFVIPEYLLGAIMSLVACFAAFGVHKAIKRSRVKTAIATRMLNQDK